jgi:hypothetical protein
MFETGLLFRPTSLRSRNRQQSPFHADRRPGATPGHNRSLHARHPHRSAAHEMVLGALRRLPVNSMLPDKSQSRNAGRGISISRSGRRIGLRCVMWRSDAAVEVSARRGLEVVATGGVDVFEPRGQYQLYVRRLEPRGVGALELAFRQLKERLGREGLFDPARKRRLPRFPRVCCRHESNGRRSATSYRRWRPIAAGCDRRRHARAGRAAGEVAGSDSTHNAGGDRLGGST